MGHFCEISMDLVSRPQPGSSRVDPLLRLMKFSLAGRKVMEETLGRLFQASRWESEEGASC